MIVKRMLRTALCLTAGIGGPIALLAQPRAAHGDVVTGISNLSQANRLSIFHDYSIDAVGITSGSTPGSPGTGIMTSVLGSWASTDTSPTANSLSFYATPIGGYDSNPEARRVGQGSAFGGADIAALYRIDIGPADPTVGSVNQIRFSYDATGAIYDGTVFNADTFQQTGVASYRRNALHDTVFLGFTLKDQFTTEYGNAFLNTLDAIPSVEWLMIPQASIEGRYDITRFDYFIRPITVRNPDAVRSTVNAEFHFYPTPQVRGPIPEAEDVLGDILRQTLHRATVGYAAVFNEAAGHDYNYEANRVYVGVEGVTIPQLHDVVLDTNYAHEWDNYMNPNDQGPIVLAGSPKQIRRKDHMDVFTLRGSAKLFELPENRGTLTTFVQWNLIADRSNLESLHFNEFIVSGGVSYRW
jgi:hypothetical protein